MFGLQAKLIAAGIVLALLGGLLWHDHYVTKKLNATKRELSQANADLLAERENTRKANESAKRYASRLTSARGPRSPPLRIMCKLPSSVPQAPSGTDDAPAPDYSGVHAEVDIGARLELPFRACEENLIKLEELQRFLR
jgi:hypothetical protein